MFLFLGLCNGYTLYHLFGEANGFMVYIGCMVGIFAILSCLLYMCFYLMSYPSTKALSYIILLSIFPTWILGVGFLFTEYALYKKIVIIYHIISYLVGSALVAAPLKYICYLYPKIVELYNPFLIQDDDFKVTDEHLADDFE